jgi:hypothetical protein
MAYQIVPTLSSERLQEMLFLLLEIAERAARSKKPGLDFSFFISVPLQCITNPDPTKRMSPAEVKLHPFLSTTPAATTQIIVQGEIPGPSGQGRSASLPVEVAVVVPRPVAAAPEDAESFSQLVERRIKENLEDGQPVPGLHKCSLTKNRRDWSAVSLKGMTSGQEADINLCDMAAFLFGAKVAPALQIANRNNNTFLVQRGDFVSDLVALFQDGNRDTELALQLGIQLVRKGAVTRRVPVDEVPVDEVHDKKPKSARVVGFLITKI